MKNITTIINWTWELPQTLLGWIVMRVYEVRRIKDYQDVKMVLLQNALIGISLGRYIIFHYQANNNTKKHEYGHTKQSKYLGPLYLIVVGLPSIILNILSRIIGGKFAKNYYNRFPENWADKLGRVTR
ncbi:MAG: hypothetical protein ACC656_10425 [Candidatus Heimdallarchaeota archaeon]